MHQRLALHLRHLELFSELKQPKVRDVLFMLILKKENSYCFHYPISLIAYLKYLYFFCFSFSLLIHSFFNYYYYNGNLLKLRTDSLEKVI